MNGAGETPSPGDVHSPSTPPLTDTGHRMPQPTPPTATPLQTSPHHLNELGTPPGPPGVMRGFPPIPPGMAQCTVSQMQQQHHQELLMSTMNPAAAWTGGANLPTIGAGNPSMLVLDPTKYETPDIKPQISGYDYSYSVPGAPPSVYSQMYIPTQVGPY